MSETEQINKRTKFGQRMAIGPGIDLSGSLQGCFNWYRLIDAMSGINKKTDKARTNHAQLINVYI